MSLPTLDNDLNIIQQLDDEPNDVGGLSAAELKAKFDEGGLAIQSYLNQVLIPALEAAGILDVLQTADSEVKYLRLNDDDVIEVSADGETWIATASSGHIVLDKDGNELPQRARMQFSNSEVTDENGVTVVHGIKGDKGDQGDQGEQGIQGIQGERGQIGPVIVPSVDANGVMSFTIQDTAIAPGSVSVRGPQGPQGVQGAQGAQGERGPQGIQGVQGAQGIQGLQGETGPAGATGPAGPQGPTGPQGVKGDDGADGTSFVIQDVYPTLGALKTAYPTGNEYAYQVTAEDDEIFIWSELASDWTSLGKLQGPQGPQGPAGPTGPTGATGATGPQGPQGIQGIQGPQGATGPEGPQGPAGAAGADGKSAYQSAVEAGYSGTESAFNAALADVPSIAFTYAPINHANSNPTYGAGSGSNYGHVKLSDSTTSTSGESGGVAATPAAVKAVKDATPAPSSTTPAMDGTAAAGSEAAYARGDHVHPRDTSKADQSVVETLVRPNLLDNWFFVGGGSQQGGGQFPINQRGQTSYTNSNSSRVYTIDRWKTQNGTVSLTSSGLQLSFTTLSVQCVQIIKNGEKLYGKKVTLSAIADGSFASTVITIPQSPTTGTIGSGLNFPSGIGVYLRLSSDGLYVSFYATSSYTINTIVSVTAIKLELGDTQTLAHQENGEWVLNEIPNYQQELAKCQRYAIELNPFGQAYAPVGNGHSNGSFCGIFVPTPVPMRAKPTVSYSGSWVLEVGTKAVSDITVDYISGNGVKLKVTSSNTIPSGTYYTLEPNNDTTARLFLSADL